MPIYQTGERFGDWGWYMQGLTSATSALSMMLPGMAVSKGVGLAAKMLKLSQTTGAVAYIIRCGQWGVKTLEAAELKFFKLPEEFQQLVVKYGEEEAANKVEEAGAMAAALAYNANWINYGFDLLQLAVLRPLKYLTRGSSIAPKVAAAHDATVEVG